MYSASCYVSLLNVKGLKSLIMEKRKNHLNSMFCTRVPQAASALLAVNARGVAGIQMLSLSWVAPASSCTLQLASAALSAPAFSCDPTATPGSPCSVQTTLLVRVPPRWLQPDYILRQLLDSWETHSLAIKYTPSVGCPAVGLPPCHQPGKRLFSLETPNATCQTTPKTLT